jgi:glycosyltransferase involved in cell wall biosynthesis
VQKDRLNILFVSPYLPHSKVGTAGGLIVYNEIRLLARRHNVSLLCFMAQNERQFVGDIAAYCSEVKTVEFLRLYDATASEKLTLILDRGVKFISSLLSSKPYPIKKYWSGKFASTMKDWTSSEQFDIVQIEFTQMAQYARFAKAGALVLLEHDVSFVPRFRQYWKDNVFLRRLYRKCEWLKMLRHEIKVNETFDHVFTLSENDRYTLLAFNPDLKVTAILTGIDLENIHPADVEQEKDSIAFMGSFGHRPNVDAVVYFREKIYPIIKSAKPDIKIYIMGRNEEFLPKLPEDFVITGFQEDVAPVLGKCQAFIAPITWGGGIKVKVLHAMAMGLPVVTTPVGAEGLDVDHGMHLFIDSQPDKFAHHVLDLLDNPDLRKRIGQAGLQKVQEKYSWDAIIDHMEELYYSLLLN